MKNSPSTISKDRTEQLWAKYAHLAKSYIGFDDISNALLISKIHFPINQHLEVPGGTSCQEACESTRPKIPPQKAQHTICPRCCFLVWLIRGRYGPRGKPIQSTVTIQVVGQPRTCDLLPTRTTQKKLTRSRSSRILRARAFLRAFIVYKTRFHRWTSHLRLELLDATVYRGPANRP